MSDLFNNEEPTGQPKTNTDILPAIFEGREIRTAANKNGELVYCFSDILAVATGTANPRHEMVNVKKALEKDGIQLYQIMEQFKFKATNGKFYKMWGGTREQILHTLQYINSPRVAPVKKWLAHAGEIVIKEAQNPDLAIKRGYENYCKKGMSPQMAMKRAKSVLHRNCLTDQWKSHGISQPREFAMLTDRESKGIFGKTTGSQPSAHPVPKRQHDPFRADCARGAKSGRRC